MPKDWKIYKGDVDGGPTGQLLDGCEVRVNAEGTAYEFISVLAQTDTTQLPKTPFYFPQFAYRGLIWNIQVVGFEGDDAQLNGTWNNNAKRGGPPQEEGGTYTAQSGPGTPEGKEDVASASA